MNFFKSVFSEDPDPSDLQNNSQSPKIQDPDQDPNPNPESSSGSAWDFGGLIKTLALKSETVIQTYRRDLEEFGSGLKKETEIIREVASRAVKDLPVSIEVGASAAQESLESVWRGTTEIISNSKEAILSPDFDTDNVKNSKRYSRFEMQVNVIQSDLSTYCDEPADDLSDFSEWKLGFVLEEKGDEIENLMGENEVMEEVYGKLVPSVVDHETFWCRYFYRVFKLKQAEDARASLVKRAISGEEEELSWDVDDDDSSGYEARSSGEKRVIAESVMEKKGVVEAEGQSSDVVDSKTDDETPVVECTSDNAYSEKTSDEKVSNVGKSDDGEISKDNDLPVVTSQRSVPEEKEEDIGWDEIEDTGSSDDKKVTVAGSPKKQELRKQLSAAVADDEEDLTWDIEDDDEPVKR